MNASEALCVAADSGNLGAIRRALDDGADPNALVPGKFASGEEYETTVATALVAAAGKGHLAAVVLLLDRGASPDKPNSRGTTPLMNAAGQGLAAMVGLLAERGADLHATDPEGFTAFHFACAYNQHGCVDVLIRAGCDMTAKTKDGRTGKQYAKQQGHTDVLECLRNLVAERLGEALPPGGGLTATVSPFMLKLRRWWVAC